jgi:hypothetical protein
LAYLEQCRNYHETWLKHDKNLKIPVLNIRTDEEANFNDESDPGLLWLDRIEVFLDLLSNKV